MLFLSSLLTSLVSVLVLIGSSRLKLAKAQIAIRMIAGLIGSIALLIAFFKVVVVIPTGEVGVEDLEGQVAPQTLSSGFNLVNPFSEVVTFSTRLQDVKETIEATSKEGLAFDVDVSLQYQIAPEKAALVYQKIGTDSTDILTSRFRATVREVTASYPVEAIYSTKRAEVTSRLQQRLTEQIEPLGFRVEAVLLREIKLPDTLQAAIQEKLKAEQATQQMKFTLEQERQEAERKRIEAQGIADSQKIVSQGLTPAVLQLRAIEATEKLAQSQNSKVVVMGGGQGGTPVILQPDLQTAP
ncbi:prohibitin family protein [Phormidium tenue FACHB-886]|nr:prohibitin family protein [Phormidium tenue FACHB-886]